MEDVFVHLFVTRKESTLLAFISKVPKNDMRLNLELLLVDKPKLGSYIGLYPNLDVLLSQNVQFICAEDCKKSSQWMYIQYNTSTIYKEGM